MIRADVRSENGGGGVPAREMMPRKEEGRKRGQIGTVRNESFEIEFFKTRIKKEN
jgi:hypothetical protein